MLASFPYFYDRINKTQLEGGRVEDAIIMAQKKWHATGAVDRSGHGRSVTSVCIRT